MEGACSFRIVGDGECEIYVTGKDVVVNGSPVADYKAWIHKGDNVSIEVNNPDIDEPRVHFFEPRKKRRWWLLWLF